MTLSPGESTYQLVSFEDLSSRGDGNVDHLSVALQSMETFAHVSVKAAPRQQILVDVVVLVHLVQELLVQVLQVALVGAHHVVFVVLVVVVVGDVGWVVVGMTVVGAIPAAAEACLAVGAEAAVAAHQVAVVGHRVVVRLHHVILLVHVVAGVVLVGAVETRQMTFVVVFVVVAVHRAQQFGAQVDGHLRLGFFVFIVLIVDHVDVNHIRGIARRHHRVALQAVHAVAKADAETEIRQHR